MANQTGQKDQSLITGRIVYIFDGTNSYAMKGGTDGRAVVAQREPFIFRPGSAAMANGAVLSGTRSGAGTIATAGTASSTYWGTEVIYNPLRTGKIDGKASGGILQGQITIGVATAASTADAKLTARIRNNPTASTADTTTWTTVLALTGTIACTTAEIYKTYDIPYLETAASINAVPFGVAIGVQTNLAGTACQARIMESSYIQGEFEPLT